MSADSTGSIEIENIGPLDHLSIPYGAGGDVIVLRGMNGEGKSTALDAAGALIRGAGRLQSRDNTTGGSVTGFGVTIKVGRAGKNRRTGDLVVESIEDRLSIADFVDPDVKDLYAADAKRMRALVSLSGVKADATIFYKLAGSQAAFEAIASPEALKELDPIVMADRIKRDFEAAARIQTARAERLFNEYRAKTATQTDLKMDAEHDATTLQQALELALGTQSALDERAKLAIEDANRRSKAEGELSKAAREYTGPTVADAQAKYETAEQLHGLAVTARTEAQSDVTELKRLLAEAESRLTAKRAAETSAAESMSAARTVLDSATSHIKTLDSWQQALDVPGVAMPSEGQRADAAVAVEAARAAHELGVLIRDALKRRQEAESLDQERDQAVKRAEALRAGAAGVLDVLAETVNGLIPGLKLDPELRIIVPHKKRKECFFADLSDGERWSLALDIAVASFKKLDKRGVLAIPQKAWEGLDGANRRVIREKVATTDLIVITAEAERDESATYSGVEVDVLPAKKPSSRKAK